MAGHTYSGPVVPAAIPLSLLFIFALYRILPFIHTVTVASSHQLCTNFHSFLFSNMDLSRLSTKQLTQFQSLLQTLPQDPSTTSVSSTTASSQLPAISNAPSQIRDPGQGPRQVTPPPPSSLTALTAPISPHHGMHTTQNTIMTSQGHPSLGMGEPSSQPFLELKHVSWT
jgi:hypothetical protein